MNANNLLAKVQHGFMEKKSCVTQLIPATEDWLEMLDNKSSIDVIYFDFQKAFDTVPHRRRLHKMELYGITGKLKN